MKKYVLTALLISLLAFFLWGCVPPVEMPDLVISDFNVTGTPVVQMDQNVAVPIRVVVKNQGNIAAGIFKVSLKYTGSQGTFAVSFKVEGEDSIWYPYTNGNLSPGAEVAFEGHAIFIIRGETVSLVAIADSCSGDEFMPDYCRVNESNETNNESQGISIVLP